MSAATTDLYDVALDLYRRAAARIARRAGQPWDVQLRAVAPEAAAHAEALALGSNAAAVPADGAEIPALQSVVAHLSGRTGNHRYYAPQVISGGAALPDAERPANLGADYATLWADFAAEWGARVDASGLPSQIRAENAHGLLYRYGWSMAAPGEDSDISLFDHARVSAALAVCTAERRAGDPVALLVGGDLSGVQEWLYTIGSENAARSLRGRSVYLQLLSEIIALFLLDALHLPSSNLLYAGGGNFYLLAPPHTAADIERLRREISRKLLAMHSGALYLALGATPVDEDALVGGATGSGVGAAWGRVTESIGAQKRQRFAELEPAEMAQAIGAPLEGTGRLEDSCRICRRPIDEEEKGRGVEDADGGRVCDLCISFEVLGNLLPRAAFLAVARFEPRAGASVTGWQEGLRTFGYDVQFLQSVHARGGTAGWQDRGDGLVRVYYWQGTPELTEFPGWPGDARTVWAFRPLAQCAPDSLRDQGRVATFDELKGEGIDRWGVLRMDVDHLGRIFQTGIPANNLSRVVGLSGLLRLFFEAYLPARMAAEYNRAEPAVYLMYSGGDDLFIVGGWSHLPGLAWEIRRWLDAFAGNRPGVGDNLTISGGITIAPDLKYPLYQAAHDAAQAERLAKNADRDALAFLGQAVKWDHYPYLAEFSNELARWTILEDGALPRSVLGAFMSIYGEWQQYRKRERGELGKDNGALYTNHTKWYFGPWQWHLVYTIARQMQRLGDDEISQKMEQRLTDIVGGRIESLGLITRWAELRTRLKEE